MAQNLTQALGAITGSIGLAAHALETQKQTAIAKQGKQAEIASLKEKLAANKAAYKNDTIEAAIAIRAHESEFDPEIKGKKMSEYVKVDEKGNPVLDKNGKTVADTDALTKALSSLDEKEVNTLAGKVEEFRTGKMTKDRIARMINAKKISEQELKNLEKLDKEARKVADPLSSQGK